jgi:hypothetical protein
MRHVPGLLFAFACAVACGRGQNVKAPEPPAPEQRTQDVLAEVQKQFAAEGIVFGKDKKSVSIPCEFNGPRDPCEYLLIHRKGKRHEAIFVTRSKPSVLNAALLMLGLEPGKNAGYKEKDPLPTPEEIEKGADPIIVTPPEGQQFWMTASWKGADDKQVEYCVEDLILDLTTQKPLEGADWIFLGGRMAPLLKNDPPVYVADFEGNLISICYLSPDNHLATMRHERARDDQNWIMTRECPEPGTAVTFTFHSVKPKLCADREERLRKDAAAAKK